jgi:16S rRNA (guanine527-N7)-methyltransferase
VDRRREPLPARVQDTPALPAEYDTALRLGLDELGLELSETARGAIDGHVRLLLAWTAAINLTGIRDPAEVALRHVIDSLTALTWLRERGVERLLDLGSGGGFPGIPLAAAAPTLEVTLAEPVGKKARFLETAVGATGLAGRVSVVVKRAEQLARDEADRGQWHVITARAVASMSKLVELAFPLLAPAGALVAWKRGELDDELRAASRAVDALGGGSIEVVDVDVSGLPGHRLVVASRSTPPAVLGRPS